MIDYAHPVYFKTGNTFQDAGIQQLNQNSKGTVTSYWRPKTGLVNIADCVDMHCDGHKKMMIVDETGDLIGYKGVILSEAEYKWHNVTRNGHKYTDTRPGLGNYRIPKAMVTTLDGKRIPYDEYAPEKGIVRDESCIYDPSLPGWYCQTSDNLRHFMMNFQMLDADYMVRRLSLG